MREGLWGEPGLLAQALQLCLGLGMAKGPECPGRPALWAAVLLLVAGVQAAHVKRAEEAALCPSVVLHQGLQAGELGWQVLGEEGASVPASPPPRLCWAPTTPLHGLLPHLREEEIRAQGGHCPADSKARQHFLFLSSQDRTETLGMS